MAFHEHRNGQFADNYTPEDTRLKTHKVLVEMDDGTTETEFLEWARTENLYHRDIIYLDFAAVVVGYQYVCADDDGFIVDIYYIEM